METRPSSEQSGRSEAVNDNLNIPAPATVVYEGQAFGWHETGTEGVVWALQQHDKDGYAGLVILTRGDYVVITAPSGNVLFQGNIEPDFDTGRKERYTGDTTGQPSAMGYWVHWTQKGFAPDDWARLFLSEVNSARLVRVASEPVD